jgi:uncharacterized protein (TIGR00369 family)
MTASRGPGEPIDRPVRLSQAELEALLDVAFPQLRPLGLRIEAVDAEGVRVRLPVDERHLRPGGTVSGPSLMALADSAMYFLVLSRIGPVPLAVTTSLNIHFLRKPGLGDVLASARMLKLGKRLAVGDVHLHSEGDEAPVAHAVVTYSIPPPEQRQG